MKKSFVIVALLAISLSSFAQVKFGAKAGMNLSNVDFSAEGWDVSPDSKAGIAAGAFVRFELLENFALQPELLYSSKGTKIDESGTGYNYSSKIKLGYLSIPVIAKYYVNSGFNLQAGPQFDFLLSAKDEWEESEDGYNESGEDDIKDDMKGLDFGLAFGLGYDHDSGFGIDARYMLGLSELMDNKDMEGVEAKSKGFQFTISYAF